MKANAPTDWWQRFFTGLMVEFWQAAIPEETTSEEAAFLVEHLRLAPGARVLDVPCGAGRLAEALAREGCDVTGLDVSDEFLTAARASSAARGLSVTWRRGDMRELPWVGEFDAAFCAGNSFGYFDDAGNAAFLEGVGRALRPGGRFVLDSGWIAEALFPHFREQLDMKLGGIRFTVHNRYDPATGRVENVFSASRGKEHEEKVASHRVYTALQVARLFEGAGLEVVGLYGTLTGAPFALGSHRLLIAGQRRSGP